MALCPKCGTDLGPIATFCNQCGISVKAPLAGMATKPVVKPQPPVKVTPPTAPLSDAAAPPLPVVVQSPAVQVEAPPSPNHKTRNVLLGAGAFILVCIILLIVIGQQVVSKVEDTRAQVMGMGNKARIPDVSTPVERPAQAVPEVASFCGVEHYPGSTTRACTDKDCVKWESADPTPDVARWYSRYYEHDANPGQDLSAARAWSTVYDKATISIAQVHQVTQINVACASTQD